VLREFYVWLALVCAGLAGVVSGQTVRTWTSDSDQRWNRSQNGTGNNPPNANNEIAPFGTGHPLNPGRQAHSLTGRGIRFSTGAGEIPTRGMDCRNTNLNNRLASGRLRLNRANISIGARSMTGNSVIDFSAGRDSARPNADWWHRRRRA
jgi:hypothetical protein